MKQLNSLHILYKNLNDNHFQNINNYCPQLKRLVLKTQQKLSNQTLYSLSKLKSLQLLKIYSTPYKMTEISDDGICCLIDNCPHLRVLTLKCGTTVTETTFDALKSRVNRWPHRLFVFEYCWRRTKEQHSIVWTENEGFVNADRFWPQLLSMPENLIIYSREYYTGWCGTGALTEQNEYADLFKTDKECDLPSVLLS
ncbi:unnamed protein product, partial [Medioppia subpectinata]